MNPQAQHQIISYGNTSSQFNNFESYRSNIEEENFNPNSTNDEIDFLKELKQDNIYMNGHKNMADAVQAKKNQNPSFAERMKRNREQLVNHI